MIDFYGFDTANSLKVLLLLEEIEADYTYHPIDIRAGEQKSPTFQAINPHGKVPTIVDHTAKDAPFVVWESAAILIYIAEKFEKFLPEAVQDRSTALQWLMFQSASCGPIFGQSEYWRLLAPEQNEAAHAHYLALTNNLMDRLEERLTDTAYFAGPDYTIADMAQFGWLWRREKAGADFKERPTLQRWYDRLADRPAAIKAIQLLNDKSAR
ncbi:MAG: glutathione S-transferase family protein [Stappiaceae bacterium]